MRTKFIDGLMDRERARDHELRVLRARVAQLTAAPTLTILSSDEDDMRGVVRYEFTWRDFRHNTMVCNQFKNDPNYLSHVLRCGVESCVRAYAELELERLVTTERREQNTYVEPLWRD